MFGMKGPRGIDALFGGAGLLLALALLAVTVAVFLTIRGPRPRG